MVGNLPAWRCAGNRKSKSCVNRINQNVVLSSRSIASVCMEGRREARELIPTEYLRFLRSGYTGRCSSMPTQFTMRIWAIREAKGRSVQVGMKLENKANSLPDTPPGIPTESGVTVGFGARADADCFLLDMICMSWQQTRLIAHIVPKGRCSSVYPQHHTLSRILSIPRRYRKDIELAMHGGEREQIL